MVKVYKSHDVAYSVENRCLVATELNENILVNEAIKEKEKLANELVKKAYVEAQKIINEAKSEAEMILNKVHERSIVIMSNSKQEGYKEGYREAEKTIKDAEEKACSIINEVNVEKQATLSSLSNEILDLSFDIAEKILNYEIDKNSNAFISLINNAVHKADDDKATVSISNDDYLNHYNVLSEDLRVNVDSDLRKGEIKVYSKKGIIDVSINKQLEKAKLVAGLESE